MNAQRLLEHFDRLVDTLDAVPRLRRFILDLAVHGKLVEQDPKDEPAGELLKRIAKEKARLIKEGSLRQQKAQTLAKEDAPFDLPVGWKWTQLAEIGEVNPRCQEDDSAATSFVPMPMISAKYGQPHEHEVRQWGEIKKGFTQFAEGDVGLAKITPCFENGKSTIFRGLTGGLGAGTTELHVLRPVFVSADYILVFLKSSHFIGTGIPKMTGTAGQKRVPREYFAFSPVPLPPLAEQHRIVAKVDELMALCDELEAAQTKREKRRDRLVAATLHGLNNGDGTPTPGTPSTFEKSARFYFNHLPRLTTRPEHIHQLRQTILNLAVRGKLVPQDPKDEPAARLLKRIAAARKHSLSNGGDRPRADDSRNKAEIDVPTGWQAVRFREVVLELQTGPFGSSLHQQDYEVGGIPVINPASIQAGRIVPISKMAVGHKTLARLATFKLRKNDVVMGRRGEMGRCAVVKDKEAGWLCGTGSLVLRFADEISPCFIVKMMSSPSIREYLGGASVGATMQNLNQSILNEMPMGLPPLAEQQRIVVKVDELMSLCDRLEARIVATESTRRKCFEASIHETLSGMF